MKEASAGDEVSVFTEASRLPEGERAAFLDRACAGDADLRRRVESLLEAHSEVGDFLEDAPWAAAAGDSGPPPVGEKPGDRIGRYRLLQSIGEGGCGVVFLAEQEEPVRRRVALKIIKPGMDTRSVIARFEAERQALALMDHPNIAKVLDAGATASGRPYFVMDWIRGPRITEYCDRARLTLCERLHLFVAVCQAVQHAHQKGILHRDLKPSNILVATREDGSAVPMVIDFGIAKATGGQRLTDKTLQTELSLPMGTPAYMSPEQAALGQDDVDTRSDVYSLGVLLYELVTGTPPIDLAVAKRAGLDEIRRQIREEEPVPPSTRLGSMSERERTAAAQARQWEPSQLVRGVRGDLDWIVMKALEKDRARRYETANGLALDVKRLLAHEAVLARPPSAAYRLGKAIRRHRVIAVSVAVVLGLVLASLVVVIAALRKEHRARLAAQTQELRSREVTGLLKNMLEGVGPAVARGRDTTLLLEILDRTAQELDRSTDGQPEVEAEMRNLLSRLYLEIGNYPKAESMAAESVRLYRSTTGSGSLETAAALNGLGAASWKLRKLPEAEAAHTEALRIRRGLLGLAHPEVASSLDQLGGVYRRQRRLNEAESLTREGLQIRRAAFGAEHLEVAESLRSLSIVLTDLGRRSEAEAAAREMLAMRRRLLGEDHPSVASALSDLAWILGRDSEESEQLESEAFEIQREVLGGKHPDLVKSIYAMGERMRQRGRLTESHTVLRAALSIQRRLLGEEHPDVLATLTGLGATLEQEGRWNEAAATYREALAVRRRQPAGAGAAASGVAEGEALVRVLMAHGELDQAERALAEFLGVDTAGQGATPALLKWRADLRGRQARWREAAADAAALVNLQPAEHYHYHMLAPLLLVLGDQAGFEQVCRRMVAAFADTENAYVAERVAKNGLLVPAIGLEASALDSLATRSLGPPGWSTPMPYSEVVKALSEVRMGRFAEGIRRAQQLSGSGEIHARSAAQAVLALGHAALGQTADAQQALREGQRLSREVMPGRDAATIGAGWLPWLSAALLLEEARQKVGGDEDPPGPEAPPLK